MRHAFSKTTFLCAMLCLCGWLHASTISVGQVFPSTTVDDRGEIYLRADGSDAYRMWQSDSTRGRVVILQHVAARLTSKSMLQAFNDAMEKRAYPPDKVLVAVVVNLDDALWGTKGLVQSELKVTKKKHPQSNIVADKNGIARKAWNLKEQNAAMAILDTDGTVLFFKEGKPSEQDTQAIIDLIDGRLRPHVPAVSPAPGE